jgi:tryptophanyl-tRNA synthetase
MSKSYDNTIPLFAPAAELRKLIAGIKTDSRLPGEPKDVEGSALFQIYQAFATAGEAAALRQAYADGIAWGDAKQLLFERIDRDIAPKRDTYTRLIANPAEVEAILQAGAQKARAYSQPFMQRLRHAVGLRSLADKAAAPARAKALKPDQPSIKQYREADGKFYAKLVDAQGKLLAQSPAFDSPKDAGLWARERLAG